MGLRAMFGVITVVFVVYLFRQDQEDRADDYAKLPDFKIEGQKPEGWCCNWQALLAGFLSGLLTGAISEGGPPVAAYFAMQRWEKERMKVSLQMFFACSGAFSLSLKACDGILQPGLLRYGIVGVPAAGLGIALGTAVYSHIDNRTFGRILAALLLIA